MVSELIIHIVFYNSYNSIIKNPMLEIFTIYQNYTWAFNLHLVSKTSQFLVNLNNRPT